MATSLGTLRKILWIVILLIGTNLTEGLKEKENVQDSPIHENNVANHWEETQIGQGTPGKETQKDNDAHWQETLMSNDTHEEKAQVGNNNTSKELEPLPDPEELLWKVSQPLTNFFPVFNPVRRGKPYPPTPRSVKKPLEGSRTKNLYYKHRGRDWVYVIPEGFDLPKYKYYYRDRNTPNKYFEGDYHEYYPQRQTPVMDGSYSKIKTRQYYPHRVRQRTPEMVQSQTPVPFLTRLYNTGIGYLRLLNPLTYLSSPADSYRIEDRERYQNRPYYYQRKPSTDEQRNPETADEFEVDFEDKEKNTDFKHERPQVTLSDFYRDDYPYDDNYYEYVEYEDTDLKSDFLNDYKYGNYFESNNKERNEMEDWEESTGHTRPTKVDYAATTQRYPQPPPNYDPRNKQKTKDVKTEDVVKKNNPHYHNIYKFQNLDMLYDPKTLERIKKVEDDHTLEYLQRGKLREDLYIGKDGNIYIRDSISERYDLYPHESKVNKEFRPSDIDDTREKKVQTRRRFPPYTTIDRNKNHKQEYKYPFWRGDPNGKNTRVGESRISEVSRLTPYHRYKVSN